MPLRLTNALQLLILTVLTESILVFTQCVQQPLYAQSNLASIKTDSVTNSAQLPAPREKIVAGVYKFRDVADQSLQKNNRLFVTTTPNYTDILVKILGQSGWFTAVAYQPGGSLPSQSKARQPNFIQVPQEKAPAPAQAPTILLEAGVMAYDANAVTEETAREYFGEGTLTRQEQITVYLRAMSASSGRIVKTIYSSKTILSQPTNIGSFRYVLFKQPLVVETGVTTTNPGELAVTVALEKAVQGLIIEGIRDGLWSADNLSPLELRYIVGKYEQEKVSLTEVYQPVTSRPKQLINLRPQINASLISVSPYAGFMRYTGDYTQREIKAAYGLSAEMYMLPFVGLQVNAATGTLASQDAFSVNLSSVELNAILRPLPYQRWTPIFYGGFGVVSRSRSNPFELYGAVHGQAQGGIGVQFSPNSVIGFRSLLSYTQPFTDAFDGLIAGSHKDYYARVVLGLVIHLGVFPKKTSPIKFIQVPQQR